ncbi:unnamed protein product [[Candida] boidinii]|uniref:Unnamed protein product n=1 Tax=Candida boidinii TaxID=5477 RepID=A0ACB5U2N6_CANBO|nr:unnamed protein product [[Candida] boidinii]
MAIPEEFDVIVCGGGSTGCVIAGRLANVDENLKVLLIENGENNLNNPWVYLPGIYPRNMRLDSKTATFYNSRPSKHLNGRRAIVPQANILGGGSSINFMMYTRASASDYDDWESEEMFMVLMVQLKFLLVIILILNVKISLELVKHKVSHTLMI